MTGLSAKNKGEGFFIRVFAYKMMFGWKTLPWHSENQTGLSIFVALMIMQCFPSSRCQACGIVTVTVTSFPTQRREKKGFTVIQHSPLGEGARH